MFVPRGVRVIYFLLMFSVLGVWLLGVSPGGLPGRGPAKVGSRVPRYAFVDRSGVRIDSSAYRGRWVLLNYWATWCEPCRREMPSLERLTLKFPQIKFVAASVDADWKDIQTFIEKHPFLSKAKLRMEYVRDPGQNSAVRFGTKKFPETYLIDPQGVLRYKYVGPFVWDSAQMVRQISSLLKRPAS